MKSRVLNILVVSLLWVACDTDSNVDPVYKDYFVKYYGEDGHQVGKDLVVNTDGTMILLGNTSVSPTTTRIFLVKVDVEGNIIWERRLGGFNEDAQDIEPILAGSFAGGYVVTTNTTSLTTSNPVFKVLRLYDDGTLRDSVVFEQYESQFSNSITSLADGGFVVTGNTSDTTALPDKLTIAPLIDQQDLLTVKFNEDRTVNTQWQKTLGGESRAKGIKVIEGIGEFYFAAYSDRKAFTGDVQNDFNFWLTALNANGSPSGTELYSSLTIDDELLSGIAKAPFGMFLAVGTKTNVAGTTKELFTATINNSFTAITSEGTSINDTGEDIEGVAVSPSGLSSFLVLGNRIGAGGNRDIWLKKVTVSFTGQVTQDFPQGITFGGPNNDDTAGAVAELSNGDIVIIGTMNLVNQNKIALIKLKANGEF